MRSGKCNALSRKIIVKDWSDVYAVQEMGEKEEVFNSTVVEMLDKTIPATAIRTHPDKS